MLITTGRLIVSPKRHRKASHLLAISTQFTRWFFAALLAVSGGAKVFDLLGFFSVVATFKVLPPSIIPAASLALALIEIALAAWLFAGRARRHAAAAVALLHLFYFAWLTVALLRGFDIPNCGCFGAYWARPLTIFTLAEDAGDLCTTKK